MSMIPSVSEDNTPNKSLHTLKPSPSKSIIQVLQYVIPFFQSLKDEKEIKLVKFGLWVDESGSIRITDIKDEKAKLIFSIDQKEKKIYKAIKISSKKRLNYREKKIHSFYSSLCKNIDRKNRSLVDRLTNRLKSEIDEEFERIPNDGSSNAPIEVDLEGERYPMDANHIQLYGQNYIATGQPSASEASLFWAMIVKERPSLLVKLTADIPTENDLLYWPNEKAMIIECPEIKLVVECTDIQYLNAKMIMRTFKVSLGEESHTLTQLDYLDWEDFSIPEPNSFRLLLDKATELLQNRKGPILVHCGAGCGRTGTFIAAHSTLKQRQQKKCVDFYSTICQLRAQRCGLVETQEQYRFLHQL